MAARGNRITGVGRFGVAFLATAAFGLASVQPVLAESAPAPPPETTNADATTDAPPTPPAPPAETTESQPPPAEPAPTPTPTPTPADPSPKPAETADGEAPESQPSPDGAPKPTEQPPAETKPAPTPEPATPAPKDAVKLEPAPAAAPAPAPAAAPTAPAPAAAAPAGAPPATVVVLVQDTPAAPDTAAAKTEALLAAAAVVSFRARPAAGPISLLPETESATAAKATRKARAVPAAARKPLPRQQTCARPAGRVPLAEKCKQVRAVAGAQVTLTYIQSLPEVRAAIARGAPPRVTIRRVEARPPPKSKAAKKRPIAEVRPIVPFGDSGQGVTNDGGFSGSTGSSSSPRLFALAVVPLRVPWPSRFARLRLPSTLPHGVIPAPPSARPG